MRSLPRAFIYGSIASLSLSPTIIFSYNCLCITHITLLSVHAQVPKISNWRVFCQRPIIVGHTRLTQAQPDLGLDIALQRTGVPSHRYILADFHHIVAYIYLTE
jgi:hypothetical protein